MCFSGLKFAPAFEIPCSTANNSFFNVMNRIDDKYWRMTDLIAKTLGNGICITETMQAYIDSTFTISGGAEIVHALTDPLHDDHEMILEFLMYPDEACQLQFELFLHDMVFSPQDVPVIAKLLARKSLVIPVFQYDADEPLVLMPMTQYSAQRYVSRLNIAWRPSAELRRCLDASPPGEVTDRIILSLRNANLDLGGGRGAFLYRFLEKISFLNHDFFSCLSFLIGVLPEIQPDMDIYAFLAERKQFYFLSIGKSVKFEQYRDKNNMEMLMMQGVRIPHVDIADAKEKMHFIDMVSHAVFGKTEYFMQAPHDVDYGAVGTVGDLGRVLNPLD